MAESRAKYQRDRLNNKPELREKHNQASRKWRRNNQSHTEKYDRERRDKKRKVSWTCDICGNPVTTTKLQQRACKQCGYQFCPRCSGNTVDTICIDCGVDK